MCPHDSDQVLIMLVKAERHYGGGFSRELLKRVEKEWVYNVRRGLFLSLGFVVSHVSLICVKMGDNRWN